MGTKWERWVPITGVLFVIGYIVGFVVAGEQPKADEGAGAIRAYYEDDGAILTATYIFGIALVFFLSYVGTLATRLREAGQQRLAAVAFGGGITIAGVAMLDAIVSATLGYRPPADDAALQALYDVHLLANVIVAFPAAVLVGAVALASQRAAVFPSWFNAAAGIAAIAFLVSGATFASDGFFAPGGGYALITTVAFMAWAVVSSSILLRQLQPAEAPRPATAPM
jgi:hypothetical protein